MFDSINLMSVTHLCYLLIGISVTIWVAHTLRVRGRIFLDKAMSGTDGLADSLSHLLSVGFYLLHIGLVLLALRIGGDVVDTVGAIELLSTKIGLVLVALGLSHFIHIALYTRAYRRGNRTTPAPRNNYVAAEVIHS